VKKVGEIEARSLNRPKAKMRITHKVQLIVFISIILTALLSQLMVMYFSYKFNVNTLAEALNVEATWKKDAFREMVKGYKNTALSLAVLSSRALEDFENAFWNLKKEWENLIEKHNFPPAEALVSRLKSYYAGDKFFESMDMQMLIPDSLEGKILHWLFIHPDNNSYAFKDKWKFEGSNLSLSYEKVYRRWHEQFSFVFKSEHIKDGILVNKDGIVLYDVAKSPILGQNLTSPLWLNSPISKLFRRVAAHRREGMVEVEEYLNEDNIYGEPILLVGTPIFSLNTNEFVGTLILVVPFKKFEKLIVDKSIGEIAKGTFTELINFALIDKNGVVICGNNYSMNKGEATKWTSIIPVLKEAEVKGNAIGRVFSFSDLKEELIVAVHKIMKNVDWYVVAYTPVRYIKAKAIKELLKTLLLILVIAVFMAWLASYVFTKSVGLASIFAEFVREARNISTEVENLVTSSEELKQTTDHTKTQISEVREAMNRTTTSIISVVTALEEMKASIETIAANTQTANEVASEAEGVASEAENALEKLRSKIDKIEEINDLIIGIADKTNLLALNASIEAARAGEAGRGFAVVAQEIKSLADRTIKGVEEIKSILEEIRGEAANVKGEFDAVKEVINRVKTVAEEIAAAVEEQAQTTSEMVQHSQEVSAAAEETNQVMENIVHAIDEIVEAMKMIASVVKELRKLIDRVEETLRINRA